MNETKEVKKKQSGWPLTILSWLLGLLFLGTGGAKLAGLPMVAAQFEGWGYPLWFVDAVGMAEVLGGLLLFIPAGRLVGSLLLAIVMVGATGTHIMAGEWASVPVPVVLLAALAWIMARISRRQQQAELSAGEEIHVAP